MAGLVFFGGIAAIYLLIPWLVTRLMRDLLKAAGIRHPILTFAIFALVFFGVWELRSSPDFFFHADQLEKFQPQSTATLDGDCNYRERYCPEVDRRIIEAARVEAELHRGR